MPIAFFDFDETLVKEKSMFSFLAYYISSSQWEGPSFNHIMEDIADRVRRGAPRSDINRLYYSLYAGIRQDTVREASERFAGSGRLTLNRPAIDRLRAHQERGDEVVVVSGSMEDIIGPVNRRLGVRTALCAEPEVVAGRYTGRLLKGAIGPDKAARVLEHCRLRGVPPAACTAYGDHLSDAAMLSVVGRAVVVNPADELRRLALEKKWEVIC
jgi:HAD superfamily hydrolase (TIGR01490 family)